MSLDVHLNIKEAKPDHVGSGIFVREDGQTKEISRAEWDEKFPGRDPLVVESDDCTPAVYSANITHNLGKMATEAQLYEYLWRPEEANITKAYQLIMPLRAGLAVLESNPTRFREFNPKNGWGTYEGLISFTREYLEACEKYPDADVSVRR